MKIANTLSETARNTVETVLGYRFGNIGLLTQAFTRASYCNEAKQVGIELESNEVPEFFGDAILGYCAAVFLLEQFVTVDSRGMHARVDEGKLAAAKTLLTDKSILSLRIRECSLCRFLLITVGESAQEITDSMAEDLFEALVCAVWVDSGYNSDVTLRAVRRLLRPEELLSGHISISPKNDVQEWCQARSLNFGYELLSYEGPDHNRTYRVVCRVEGVGETEGVGASKKKAELAAAAAMLPLLDEAAGKQGFSAAFSGNGDR